MKGRFGGPDWWTLFRRRVGSREEKGESTSENGCSIRRKLQITIQIRIRIRNRNRSRARNGLRPVC
jgi:hypothetical protein